MGQENLMLMNPFWMIVKYKKEKTEFYFSCLGIKLQPWGDSLIIPLTRMNWDFDEGEREGKCIKVVVKPPRKQIELEVFTMNIHIPKTSKHRFIFIDS